MLTIMKRITMMMGMLLMAVCWAYGQNIIRKYAPHTKRGELPPAWIKNKVTDAQYDSLAMLSKYYWVNYDYFKQRDLTKERISIYVSGIKRLLSEENLKQIKQLPKDAPNYYDYYPGSVLLKPFMVLPNADGSKQMKYIVYSEIDGYDAHVMVEARVNKNTNGNIVFSKLKLVPYSVSGLKVEIDNMDFKSESRPSYHIVYDGVYDTRSLMSEFKICGLLKFEDAMGYHHTELVQQSFYLLTE